MKHNVIWEVVPKTTMFSLGVSLDVPHILRVCKIIEPYIFILSRYYVGRLFLFVSLAMVGKDIVFRFIIEYIVA
jgi:hypothetical protein